MGKVPIYESLYLRASFFGALGLSVITQRTPTEIDRQAEKKSVSFLFCFFFLKKKNRRSLLDWVGFTA